MNAIVDRLPSPAGFALWLYALAFAVLPAILAWNGFAYVVGIVVFAIGLKPTISHLAQSQGVHLAMRLGGRRREAKLEADIPSESIVARIVSYGLILAAILLLPLVAFVLHSQARVFYQGLEARLPEILMGLRSVLGTLHGWMPDIFPKLADPEGQGWTEVSDILTQVAGDAADDVETALRGYVGSAIGVVGQALGDWVKLVIGALIAGTILAGYETESRMHRGIVARGIKDERLRANVLRFGELYQSGVSLFMIGYLEVAVTLTLFYVIGMGLLPLGIGPGAIIFSAVVLGVVTAIPKIGGILAMGVAFVLMIARIEPGLGWFGLEMISFGWWGDLLIRVGLLMALAKAMGLLEAYNYTPEIVGKRLGMTKMQIIATVVIWAVGAGVFGLMWGIMIALAFQAALRLSLERAAETEAEAEAEAKARTAAGSAGTAPEPAGGSGPAAGQKPRPRARPKRAAAAKAEPGETASEPAPEPAPELAPEPADPPRPARGRSAPAAGGGPRAPRRPAKAPGAAASRGSERKS